MENLDKKYYRIAEVAAIVGVPQSTLRFWESRFRGVIKPRRNAGGTRFYTPADVEAVGEEPGQIGRAHHRKTGTV